MPNRGKAISQREFIKIVDFLRNELAEWLKAEKPNYAEVVHKVSRHIGRPITVSQLESINKSTVPSIWQPQAGGNHKGDKRMPKIVSDIKTLFKHAGDTSVAVNDLDQKVMTHLGELGVRITDLENKVSALEVNNKRRK
jgi:hypothetical protein